MDLHLTNAGRAEVLTQALPYIQKYYGKVVVIKYGGNAMVNETLKQQVMEDIVLLHLVGIKIVLVHGGGPEITETLQKVGKTTEFVGGLRVTDKETVDVVQMVLAGKINKSLVNLLGLNGGKAVGLSGLDGRMIRAKMKDERLGYVGDVVDVDVSPIQDLLEKDYIPVVSTLGCDDEGNVYNINADTAAAFIAGKMKASRLIMMTDIEGILRDRNDPKSLIPLIDLKEADELFKDGVISGGMIPKVDCCITAIHKGVRKVIILDGRVPHALLIETMTDEGAGTMVVKEKKDGNDF
ncbi:MAG: acetylglutamate kinase [Clostridiales bacterium]|nr:acetylglutamate kinase [Clostridiales bacterium]